MKRKSKKKLEFEDTTLHTWFERGSGYVELRNAKTGKTIIEWRDDDINQAVEDGFLDPRNLHWSAYEYARHIGRV